MESVFISIRVVLAANRDVQLQLLLKLATSQSMESVFISIRVVLAANRVVLLQHK
jgi:hypothetical protein